MKLSELPIGSNGYDPLCGRKRSAPPAFPGYGTDPGDRGDSCKIRCQWGIPLELRIHGYELTIRLEDAENIEISEPHQPVDVQKKHRKQKNIIGLWRGRKIP